MLPILFQQIFSVRLVRLKRLVKGDNKDLAPKSPISFQERLRVKLERLRKFAKGEIRDCAPISPI